MYDKINIFYSYLINIYIVQQVSILKNQIINLDKAMMRKFSAYPDFPYLYL
jgi:hypothetical protein